jgi:hypothetical protein
VFFCLPDKATEGGSGSGSSSQRYLSGSASKCHGSPTLIKKLHLKYFGSGSNQFQNVFSAPNPIKSFGFAFSLKLTVLFIYSQTPTGGSASRHRPKQLFQGNENADPANLTASDLDDFPDLLSVSDEVMGQSPNPPASQVLQQIQNVMAGKMFL